MHPQLHSGLRFVGPSDRIRLRPGSPAGLSVQQRPLSTKAGRARVNVALRLGVSRLSSFHAVHATLMTDTEMAILTYLRQSPETWFNRKEISRRARSKEDFEENPHWANAALAALVDQKYVIQNESGHYQVNPKFARA